MKTLPYIEDYIELMAPDFLNWPPRDPPIKLARYDEPIVISMAEQSQRNLGFTDRQSVLAHKIVIKYRRQWAQMGYDVEHLATTPKYRNAIRVIDRSTIIDIVDGGIEIRFPYNQELISHIRATVNELPGRMVFDRDRKCWVAALIEPRLIWAREFGLKHEFEFGSEFTQAINDMLAQSDYLIHLERVNGSLTIRNAAESLLEYIDNNGGFADSNLLRLIDMAGICGYTVDQDLYAELDCELDRDLIELLSNRDTNLVYPDRIDLDPVIRYARLTNRWPIYVYESGASVMRQQIEASFAADDIVDLKTNPRSRATGSVVYFSNWRQSQPDMPLLVTTHTLMIGSRRQQMLQSANKVVYFTQQVKQDA